VGVSEEKGNETIASHLDLSHGRPDFSLEDPEVFRKWADDESRVSLVMFSSGIDSAYTLVKLLSETKHHVLVHHIHFINDEGRYEVEAARTHRIIKECEKRYRPFFYSESAIDHRKFPFFGYDIVSVGFEAGIVAHSYKVTHGKMIDGWTIGTCTEEGHREDRFQYVKACCAANCFPNRGPAFYMLPMVTKKEETEYLPSEVLDLCWTCRWPIKDGDGFRECGECQTCLLMKEVRAE